MDNVYHVVVIGLHHDHVWSHLEDIEHCRGAKLVGVADPNLPLLNRAREHYHCLVYTDYDELLSEVDADIAYIFTSNRQGAELAVLAANRGLHVLIEKPMAADLAGAEAALAAAKANQVRMMVNWPFAWSSGMQTAIKMATAGELGRLWQVKYRAAHQGPRQLGCSDYFCDWLYDEEANGGGALIDYGCYGCVLSCVLLGRPKTVQANSGNFGASPSNVEDNAILLLNYPEAIGISEASWTQAGNLSSYIASIHGINGSLIVESAARPERLSFANGEDLEGHSVSIPTLEAHLRSATHHLCWALENDEPLMPLVCAEVARDAQSVLASAQLAAELKGVTVV